jgi:tetratricopeptide (TPR) repeat protein
LGRDLAKLSASDLVSCYAVADHWLRVDVLLKLAPALTAKMSALSDADLPYIVKGAAQLARDDWTHSAEEIALLRSVIDRCGQGTPSPALIAVGSQARLALARLVYKTSDKLEDVKTLVDAINVPLLTGEEPHVLDLLKADMLLAAGDVPGARKEYVRLTGDPSGPDVRSSIRRTAKIGQARSYMEAKDYDAAEGALNEVAWKAPIEKLSPDWALTRLRLYQEEGLTGPAYIWAKRLMPVLTDTGRSELLLRLTDLAFAQNDNEFAQKALSELLKKHPYSEEAAQAKQKWPGKE